MSTTYGILIEGEVNPIARNVSGEIFFTNSIAKLLPKKTKVIAIDNDPNGIKTIKDLFEYIKKQDIK